MNNKHDILLNIQALQERLKTCQALERDLLLASLKVWEKRSAEWKGEKVVAPESETAKLPEPKPQKKKSKKVR